ncbi:MAG TPA: DUF5305 family protein, partial [Acidimicrobiia bacterium]|nr:DUF5305 family protein [Acidimicrobiia bacterium]
EMTGLVRGQVGDEVYAPEFSMELSDGQLIVDGERVQRHPVEERSQARVANTVELPGLSVAPAVARGTAAGALVLLLVFAGAYAASEWKRAGRGEVAKIRLRYGSLIVPLHGDVPNGVPHAQVSSMGDLVRLARRNEQLVFHHEPVPGEHRFFVPDGTVAYEYQVLDRQPPT